MGIRAFHNLMVLDQACVDLFFADPHGIKMKQQIEQLDGLYTQEHAQKIGLGSRTYKLIRLD